MLALESKCFQLLNNLEAKSGMINRTAVKWPSSADNITIGYIT
jgi:hypothetical protein